MRDRGHHGNIGLESDNADRAFSDAVGMLVTRCSVFEAVSVSGGKRGEFVGTIVVLGVMPDKAIHSRGVVVPLGREIEKGGDASAKLWS
jgi:hypothetical protein